LKRKISQKKLLKNKTVSLEEFCSMRHYQNLYAKYLWGMKIDDFDFVGITENYENSLRIFRAMYGVSQVSQINIKNVNPEKSSPIFQIDEALRIFIRQKNQNDYHIYDKALAINGRLEKEYFIRSEEANLAPITHQVVTQQSHIS
jgi:hypothetical protein